MDFMGMMKQAAQLQSKMQALQAELDTITVDGTAGGGVVTVTLTAKGDLKAVKIDDSMMKPGEAEIVILPPIPTAGMTYDDREKLRDLVRRRIEEELDRQEPAMFSTKSRANPT